MVAQDFTSRNAAQIKRVRCAMVEDFEVIKPMTSPMHSCGGHSHAHGHVHIHSKDEQHVRKHRGTRKANKKCKNVSSNNSSNANSSRDSSCSSKKSAPDSPTGVEAKKDYKMKYKTEICKNWEVYGSCKFGSSCAFAHGQHEIRRKVHLHENYRTKQCKSFFQTGFCIYGSRCQFLHDKRNFHDVNLKGEITGQDVFCYSDHFSGVINNIHTKMRESGKNSLEISISDPLLKYSSGASHRPRLHIFERITVASEATFVM